MSVSSRKLMGATAGAEFLAVEEVFQSWLYTGNGSTQTITNGIDLAGEGGLVWTKRRSTLLSHQLFDTLRGVNVQLSTDVTNGNTTVTNRLNSFNVDGFTLGGGASGPNVNAETYASWTFRKAPRFFDVVTYTGNGQYGRAIPHDLGVVPGCVIVKQTSGTGGWRIKHRNAGDMSFTTAAANAGNDPFFWGDGTVYVPPTSTHFTVGGFGNEVNQSGQTYVAYLFAHDPLGPSGDGSDGLIACGSYTTDGSGNADIDLGWEPQWFLTKRSDSTGGWSIRDTMRRWGADSGASTSNALFPNDSTAESTGSGGYGVTSTGVAVRGINTNATFIYIAIRRGPMREPTVGTEVFAVANGTTPVPTWKSGFPVDLGIYKATGGNDSSFVTRLLGKTRLVANSSVAEAAQTNAAFDYQNGHFSYYDASLASWYSWMFRRAPGFFDVVAYTGNGSTQTINHNLNVTPELIITKRRNGVLDWSVHHTFGSTNWNILFLNSASNNTLLSYSSSEYLSAAPTSKQIFLGSLSYGDNISAATYISYLFASLPGISKVGSYTGNGSSQTINCGFTTGARFVLIKRKDNSGDWYVWDTARGIVSGNDPRLILNTTAAEVTTDDTIDPANSGFIVNQVSATNVNVNAATYIYLAIA